VWGNATRLQAFGNTFSAATTYVHAAHEVSFCQTSVSQQSLSSILAVEDKTLFSSLVPRCTDHNVPLCLGKREQLILQHNIGNRMQASDNTLLLGSIKASAARDAAFCCSEYRLMIPQFNLGCQIQGSIIPYFQDSYLYAPFMSCQEASVIDHQTNCWRMTIRPSKALYS
jgi:hypothetical protein